MQYNVVQWETLMSSSGLQYADDDERRVKLLFSLILVDFNKLVPVVIIVNQGNEKLKGEFQRLILSVMSLLLHL